MQKIAVVDIETNGAANRITDIAVIVYDGNQIIDEFKSLVNPGGRIPSFITALTGITEEMLYDAPRFEEIADEVYNITQDCIFVAHSVNFDYNIIRSEFQNIGRDFQRQKLCSVRLSRKVIPGHKSYSLGNICGALHIPIYDRHRAYGDAQATLRLIQHLQTYEHFENCLEQAMHARSQEATIPSGLDKEEFERLPHAPGIYYFYNDRHEIIYIGKAKNIKKRVLSHFYNTSRYKSSMLREIAHVDFSVAGTELLALLMEDSEIKRNFPKFNIASKNQIKGWALVSYYNRRGILNLGIQNMTKTSAPHRIFYGMLEARLFVEKLVEEYRLCPRYCQLLENVTNCDSSIYNSCDGICSHSESVENYNEKVRAALAFVEAELPDGVIKLKGRQPDEDAFVRIKNGKYCGYGFIPKNEEIRNEEIDQYLISQSDNMNVRQILKNTLHLIEKI
ncbi:MAG: exonuclease domain-containing protein [Flavobacteriaceae bacterium]|nr:exonuclease domain-containing protein [Flavobacteriaceae bacterium]